MKYLTLALFLASMNVSAAVYQITPDPITTSAGFHNSTPVNGSFTDTYVFNVLQNDGGAVAVTNIQTQGQGWITDMQVIIDGTIIATKDKIGGAAESILNVLSTTFSSLTIGEHQLVISGNAVNASYGGNLTIIPANAPVGAVPIPGAVWLFGSALVGLMGFSRKKK